MSRAKRIFNSRRAEIFSSLAFALERGAAPGDELQAKLQLAKRRRSRLVHVYQAWRDEFRGRAAGSLVRAMRSTLSTSDYTLLASAEATQQLPRGLQFLANTAKQFEGLGESMSAAIRSVVLPAGMLLSLYAGMDQKFFPAIAEEVPRRQWPMITVAVADLAHYLWLVVATGAVVIPFVVALWIWSLSRWTGRGRSLMEHTFLYSKYRDYQCVVLLKNLAFLMQVDVPPRAALEQIRANSNDYIRWHINTMLARLDRSASNIGDAITCSGLFSLSMGDLLVDYARWPDWFRKLDEIADRALRIVMGEMHAFAARMQTSLTLFVGVNLFAVLAAGAGAIGKMLVGLGQIN